MWELVPSSGESADCNLLNIPSFQTCGRDHSVIVNLMKNAQDPVEPVFVLSILGYSQKHGNAT